MPDAVDIVVCFSPVEEEFAALASEFEALQELPRQLSDGSDFWTSSVERMGALPVEVLLVRLKAQGVLHACAVTTKAVVERRPWLVVSFGIAGGFLGDDVELEDVICATVVYYYEPAKETTQSMDPSLLDEVLRTNNPLRLPQFVPFTSGPHIQAICRRALHREEHSLQVRFGPFASGEKLIASSDAPSREAIMKIQRKMLGVDMEAAGVAAAGEAVPLSHTRLESLAIKGVSDDATTSKPGQSECRPRAAANAARFLRLFLEQLVAEPILPGKTHANPQPARQALRRANDCLEALAPFVAPRTMDARALARLFTRGRSPKAYYHWRAKTPRVHWVDFYYLRALASLSAVGIGSHLIISERSENGNAAVVRAGVEEQVRSFLPDCEITWEEELDTHRAQYVAHAGAKGFDRYVRAAIADAPDFKGIPDHKRVAEEVLQFVTWDARQVDSALYLTWSRLEQVPGVLTYLLDFDCVVAAMPDMTLGSLLAKEGEPGWRMVLEPPNYAGVLDWVGSKPEIPAMEDLSRFLTVGLTRRQELDPLELALALPREVKGMLSDDLYGPPLAGILDALDQYNSLYFGDAGN